MGKRAGSLPIVLSCFICTGVVTPVLATQSDEQSKQVLPQACFDTGNTSAACQTLYRYTELLGFGNIQDYVGFIESFMAEVRGEIPYLPLDETPEVKRFVAVRDSDEDPSEAMIQELNQFQSHWLQGVADFRYAQDWVFFVLQELLFGKLMRLNAQLFPDMEELAAIEMTFLQANPRLPGVLRQPL